MSLNTKEDILKNVFNKADLPID